MDILVTILCSCKKIGKDVEKLILDKKIEVKLSS